MRETLGLKEILKILKKRYLMIISMLVVSVGTSVGLIFFILPEIYKAQTQILVNQKTNDQDLYSWSQIDMELQLIDTYNVVIKSPAILEKVIADIKLDTTPEELSEQITVSNEENSKVVNIIVEDPNPQQSVNLANKVAEVFKEEIPNLMSVDNINILAEAKLKSNAKPVKPNKPVLIGIAALIGLAIGVGLAFIREILDTTIKNENDIEEISNIPIIGVVSPFEMAKGKRKRKLI